MANTERSPKNDCIRRDWRCRRLNRELRENPGKMEPDVIYASIAALSKCLFRGKFSKQKTRDNRRAPARSFKNTKHMRAETHSKNTDATRKTVRGQWRTTKRNYGRPMGRIFGVVSSRRSKSSISILCPNRGRSFNGRPTDMLRPAVVWRGIGL